MTKNVYRVSDQLKETYKHLYLKDEVIAIVSNKIGQEPQLYRINEDMRTDDDRSQLSVVELTKLKVYKENSFYQQGENSLLSVNSKIHKVKKFELNKPHHKDSKWRFTVNNQLLQQIARQTQAQPKSVLKDQKLTKKVEIEKTLVENDSESDPESDEVDNDESDSFVQKVTIKSPSKGVKRLPPQKKIQKKKQFEEDEEDDEQELEQEIQEKVIPTKKISIKPTKIIPQRKSRASRKKIIDYEESPLSKTQTEGTSDPEQSSEQVKKVTKRRSRSRKNTQKSVNYQRGKFNPKIEKVIQINPQLQSTNNDLLPLQAIKLNNKELIRAAYTGNMKLLNNIFKSNNKISSFFERWAPERDFNAIELLFQNGNKVMLRQLLQTLSKMDKLKLTKTPECSMREIQTGFNDKYAYGVRTRAVNLARGGREGNNALVQDILVDNDWSLYTFDRLLETQTDPILFNYLSSHIPSYQVTQFQSRIPVAVRSGNYEVAGFLIKQMLKQGGLYGYNIVHAEVLTLKDPSQFTACKRPSALKKNLGQMIITPIHCAAINPNPEFLRILLDLSNEQSIMDEIMRKPIHYAATCIGTGTLKLLLERGVDSREGDRDKNTPLMLASKFGRDHNIEVLVSQVAQAQNLNFKNKQGNAAIHMAAQGGHLECLKKLIITGANLHLTGKNRMTPLVIASAYGHFDCVEYLLEAGSKILTKDKMQRSALLMAIRNGNIDIASLLLMRGADFNGTDSSKNSCVHYAAAYGFADCVDLLIKAGADQNVKNSWNLTPLSVALQKNLFGIVKSLLNYESTDVDCKDDEGRTLVSSSLSKFTADSFEYIKFLILEKNANVTIADLKGCTPLHYAAKLDPNNVGQFYPDWIQKTQRESKEITDSYQQLIFNLIDILIEKGADINVQDNNGVTPFMNTIMAKNFSVANKFLSQKAPDTSLSDSQDQNILHLMAHEQSFLDMEGIVMLKNIFNNITNKREMLNAVDANGFTPLLLLAIYYAQGVKVQYQQLLSKLENQQFVEKLHQKLDEEENTRPKIQKNSRKKQTKAQNQKQESEEVMNFEEQEDFKDHSDPSQDHSHEENQLEDLDESDQQVHAMTLQSNFLLPPQKQILSASPFDFNQIANQFQQQPIQLFTSQTKASHTLGPNFNFGIGGIFGSQQQQMQQVNKFERQTSFTINNRAIIVGLTLEEHQVLVEKAKEQLADLEKRVFDLIKMYLEEGAAGNATVTRLKKYRFTQPSQSVQTMVEEQNHKQYEDNDSGFRGGARTFQTAMRIQPNSIFSITDPTQQISNNQRYNINGKQNMLHFFFQYYPNQITIEKIMKLVKLNHNAQDYRGKTPIILFAENATESSPDLFDENRQFLQYALDNLRVNIDLCDYDKNTATSILAILGKFTLLKQLCKSGGTLNNCNNKNQVPLIEWVKQSKIEHSQVLLALGADPNFTDKQKRSALHHAVNCSNGSADASFELEQILLINGARADILDKNNRTPLFYAFVKIGNPFDKKEIDPFETVSSLCALPDCQVNVQDQWQRTPLHYAAQCGAVISGRYLIKLGAKVDCWDGDNNTPMGIAFINGHSNFSTMMIDNRSDVTQEANVVDYDKIKQELREKRVKKQQIKQLKHQKEQEEEIKEQSIEGQDSANDTVDLSFEEIQNKQQQFGMLSNFNYFGQQQQPTRGIIAPGKHSFFMIAIKHGWQGVAYLLISDGFDLQRAIEDALNADQFKLVKTLLSKVKDNALITKLNSKNQNLFHILAQKGHKADINEATQLINEMIRRGIDCTCLDSQGRSPLHYACQYNFVTLYSKLLQNGCDPNQLDMDDNTPYSHGLQHNYDSFMNQSTLDLFIQRGLNLNKLFKCQDRLLNIMLYLISERNLTDESIYHYLIENGADCNAVDQKGLGVLSHSIIINSIRLVKFFLNHPKMNKELQLHDKSGKSPVHHVVQPLPFGSYENVEILKILISNGMNINDKDKSGLTPLDYAEQQDSGAMKFELLSHHAQGAQGALQIGSRYKRMSTSIVAQEDWPDEEVDFETNSALYLQQKEKEEKNRKNKIKDEGLEPEEAYIIQVDPFCAQQGGRYQVVEEPHVGPFSLIMTKVDIKNGFYSENVYYRMQVIHETNRNVFVLFTRWGRIGTPGQFQMTPFDNQEDAVKEFIKIFSSKAAHDWRKVSSGEVQFEKQKGKYQLMNIGSHINYKQYLQPFDFSERSTYPPCTLDAPIEKILKQFTQVKLYQKAIQELNIDQESMPLERLSKSQLIKAKSYLNEIQESINELAELRKMKKDPADVDIEQVLHVIEIIANKSSRFYELIPHRDFKNEPVPPIDNQVLLFQKYTVIETLLQFEVTSKILLGAHYVKQSINPLNYCFNALNVRMMCLPREHPEFQLIKQFVTRSYQHNEGFLKNIFALERRGEAERLEAWKKVGNRTLLWHGSKVSNYMGILAQGLKVAPPWAFNSGAMFGKGIYFADMFAKSWAYTTDYSLQFSNGSYYQGQDYSYDQDLNEATKYRYMLLCEVALGKSKKLMQAENVELLPANFQSVKGVGTSGPNPEQNVILQNGCIIPVGQIVDYEQKSKNPSQMACLGHNEFIVYDETQVRVRYLLQCEV